jgi:DNA-binding IclR family transcriptional regulator
MCPQKKKNSGGTMAAVLEPTKAKIAKRVIEIFEYFDSGSEKATVMDIVRRYGHPQSSTSELLASLVDMGLLYKDPQSRYFSPTPRMATLGTFAQPEIIRDGRLFSSMDRLANVTRSGVALFGMVGTCVQIFRWSPDAHAATRDIGCGLSTRLSDSTAGLLMLAALPPKQAEKLLWRLHAEPSNEPKFNPLQLGKMVAEFRRRGHATGPSGFASKTQVTAKLLPCSVDDRPLALGIIYAADAPVDNYALIATLNRCIKDCTNTEEKRFPVSPAVLMRRPEWPAAIYRGT